jgi:hypothetical protein
MTSPDEVERQHTLRTAVARYEELRAREILADSADGTAPEVAEGERLPAAEVLELLALSEVIARKAGYGQQLAVRTARAAGASWAAIARALGVSKQAAWEEHTRWIDTQAARPEQPGHEGLDAASIDRLRRSAGSPDDDATT